ncbi:MAG TPA: endopeptidase La [Acidimicrobiales bacterium]|nr:endopeptidase La [Acidimicrobiales bacterium]
MSDARTTPSVTFPVVPLSSTVVLPGAVVTLAIDADDGRRAAQQARQSDGRVLLVPQVDSRYARVGTVAHVENMGELPDGTVAAILRTVGRAVIGAGVAGDGLWVSAEPVDDPAPTAAQRDATRELRAVLEQIAEQRRSRRLPEILRTVHEPGALADAVTSWSDQESDAKLMVLEAIDVDERLRLVSEWARQTLGELMMAERIRNDVAEGMDKAQREFLLRQQMSAIRKELGEGDDDALDDYRAKAAALPLPENVRAQVEREIDRLERSSGQSPEQSWIRTWLDRVLELPWGKRSGDRLDMVEARAVLDADHTGLDEVKDRIVEYLGVRKLRAERGMSEPREGQGRRGAGAIIALIGPPGVGKTSLGESVARAMGRSFVRVALGGVRDEAEIRGHRRTYVGAQPGRLVRAITEAGTMNPVVLLDEVDKLSAGGWSGDPSSALLEVLDPAQNHTFRDHYLEVELDLSDVVFIATANVADTIPGPLLDRMEVVRLDGYTEDEKVVIARDHLLPAQLERNGLKPDDVEVDDDAIRLVVTDYTREAGVRNLERELAKVLRKVASKVATDPTITPVHVDTVAIQPALGRPKFFAEAAERTATPGVATGLAVTGTGGDVLFIEASASDGEPGLTLTGQLGDVMKESAQIALSFVRAHAVELGIAPSALERRFHVHVPAGAVPKDGPSAGVTMTTALVSLLTGRPVRAEFGMTGEVTLQGRVLPIGGVKQKVLAAHRAGLTEVVLPKRNGPDLDDVPERVRAVMTFHLAEDVHEVLDIALAPAAELAAA